MPGKDGIECSAPECRRGIYKRRLCEEHYIGVEPIRSCSRPGCDRPYFGGGHCEAHYQRKRAGRDMDMPLPPYKKRECSEDGCYRPASARGARGLCGMHAQRVVRQQGWNRNYHLRRKFKMSLEELRHRLSDQNHACAICSDPIGEDCHVDHDHDCCSGKVTCGSCVRGLLCGICNKGLGLFKHDTARLHSAADYLAKMIIGLEERGR